MKSTKNYLADPSAISLIVSNIIIIILAIFQKWDVTTVLWVYWMQSTIIGFFQFLRILSLKKFSTENFSINNVPALATQNTKLYTAFFFLFHYGFFHFIYAFFIFNFFKSSQSFDFSYLFLGGLVFFLNHSFSFFRNRIVDEQKIQNIGTLMFSPYARIIPMHLVIVLGAFFASQIQLVFFLGLKTAVDLLTHIYKHQKIEVAVTTNTS